MSLRSCIPVVVAFLTFGLQRDVRAQIHPACPNCLGGVAVTPDSGTDTRPASSGPFTLVFNVHNTSTSSKAFTATCSVLGGLSCVSVSPSSFTLLPDRDRDVNVTFNTGATGGTLGLMATATGASDDGSYIVTVTLPPGPPSIALKNFNGDNQDRGLCLTTGGGEATAVQCGDLLVAHAMPGYQTMGRDRSLTLVYNSASAAPRPTVATWVTLTNGFPQPDSVYAELQIAGIKRASAWYTSWAGMNRVRQIVLAAPFDTVSGIYPFTLIVRNQYSTGAFDAAQTGSLLVINRKTSEFGAGWWLAGVEQLIMGQSGNKILWLGGDGSAAVYDSIGPARGAEPLAGSATLWFASTHQAPGTAARCVTV